MQHRPSAVAYLGSRNVAMFSCDVDSFDFRSKDPDQVVNTVMTGLDKKGKGIILMHDFQKNTALALPKSTCANPDALGISRTVVVDTTGGPGFGRDPFKQFDFLADREVVLTFDDGPWPVNTPAVLKALADECTTGIFFSIGKHATYHPEILRQVLAAGHTVGVHTWSHANLNGKKMTDEAAKEELEKGFSAVKFALGTNPAPFFRFPQLQHRPSAVAYLGSRNVAMFSCDVDSFDFRSKDPDQVVNTVMTGLDK
ncbi:polysaccharide deacetylase family protein, partial [Bradyrhizobium sp.]|uniref:polysaccharide deacetylase family protein n=1 Tax=Bradyrhizobium sp. TaxID=376 RepID=UPI00391A4C89